MTGMPVRAVLFDFDFTLGDSSRAIVGCVNHAMASIGLEHAHEREIRRCIGLTLPEVLRQLSPTCGEDHQARFIEAFHERAGCVMARATELYPEGLLLVRRLRKARISTGIVSTKLRLRIDEILTVRGAADLFDVVVGFEDVEVPKPHPGGLLRAAAYLGAPVHESVYIGDHEVDVEAARSAGMRFLGVLTGLTSAERFAQLGVPCVPDVSFAWDMFFADGEEGPPDFSSRQDAPHSGQCDSPDASHSRSASV